MIHLHVNKLSERFAHMDTLNQVPATPQTQAIAPQSAPPHPSTTIFPAASRGFLCHPVENNGSMSKRGKGCASVLSTILSRGRRSSGEKRR